MAKWTKAELLCNARGLDDGYLFVHADHPLSQKLATIIQAGKSAKAAKTRLLDTASYGCAGFTGSVRPPLSNEIHLIDENTKIDIPNATAKAVFSSHDNLFTEPIDGNDSVCVAFTEPLKLPHKSVSLPGTVPRPPSLTADDLRVRRPRLNRGGGTIANMGMSNGQSYQSGHGSMNISSYERDLAQRGGRGHQMRQAGTRAWGAMEPAPKRHHQLQNPFRGGHQGGRQFNSQPHNRPPWQQQQHRPQHPYQHQQGGGQYPQNYGNPNQQRGGYQQNQGYHNRNQQGYQGGGPRNQQGGQYNNRNHHQNRPQPHQGQRQGFDFRQQAQQGSNPQNRPAGQGAQVNANVMNSLKAQLASTLKQNRKQNH